MVGFEGGITDESEKEVKTYASSADIGADRIRSYRDGGINEYQ
jgi:hypothetical protein